MFGSSHVSSGAQRTSTAAQIAFVFLLLVVLRGPSVWTDTENLFRNSDLIAFAALAAEPGFPADTIVSQFVQVLSGFSLGLHAHRLLLQAGISAEVQLVLTSYAQILMISIGLVHIGTAFRMGVLAKILATAVAFYGVPLFFGRYLSLDGLFWASLSSGHAVAIGLIILGLLLNGWDRSAAALCGVLTLYHPSHGLVAFGLLLAVQVWRLLTDRSVSLRSIAPSILIGASVIAAACLPILQRMPRAAPGDDARWWSIVANITSNMTPLQDGGPVVAGIVAAFVLAFLLLRRPELSEISSTATRASAVVLAIAGYLAAQVLVAEVFHIRALTQLAMTRSQPYFAVLASFVLVHVACSWWHRPEIGRTDSDRLAAVLLVAMPILAEVPLILPLIKLPVFIPPLIRLEAVYDLKVLHQIRVVLVLVCALYWSVRRTRPFVWQSLDVVLALFLTAYSLLLGLRLEVLAAWLLLLAGNGLLPVFIRMMDMPRLAAALAAVLLLGLVQRPGWTAGKEDAAAMVSFNQTVERHRSVIAIPFGTGHGARIPRNGEFLGGTELTYAMYAPWLAEQVQARLRLLGVDLEAAASACPARSWITRLRCRRTAFSTAGLARSDSWRSNAASIRSLHPSLTHAAVAEGHLCIGDKVEAQIGKISLVRLGEQMPAGCKPVVAAR